ncbi:MAG: excinuclease ABC subunit UvrC [Gammaproteobacteria bacterium]|nr:excinuclease ABC subunit UvrC [Gammaproteobacteria bacterium]
MKEGVGHAAGAGEFSPEALIKHLTHRPGTYEMLDANGQVIYVGKAKDLRRRVSSYFQGRAQNAKTMALVNLIADVRVTVTRTEVEALMLEYNLIKQHSPRFNVLLRDDKSYPYIHVSTDQAFPRLSFYRGARKRTGTMFGPYPSAAAVRETLSQLQKLFQIRLCDDSYFANRSRPCLQFQIKRCSAPCVGAISEAEYERDLDSALLFLRGRNQLVTERLAERMDKAAAALDYERAAQFRDQLARLKAMESEQLVAKGGGEFDVVGVVDEQGLACVTVMFFRGGRMLGSRNYFPRVQGEVEPGEVARAFLLQYYTAREAPKEILVSEAVGESAAIAAMLEERVGRRVSIRHAVRGDRARWIKMALSNARHAARLRQKASATLARQYEAMADALGLDEVPSRLECFDISHTGGEQTSASCVVFGPDGPLKSDYRRFNITGLAAGDDYGAMAQALQRRYARLRKGEAPIPDLVFIDGGRGQLAAAAKAFAEYQLEGVTLIAVAKGRGRRAGMERLYTLDRKEPLRLKPDSPALHLIQQIRDEAHRFALVSHRARRKSKQVSSPLEDIKGLGPKRRRALLREFGGLQAVSSAGVEELARVKGISEQLAESIYDHLHAD